MVNEYEINTSDLTTGVVGGTGVFDELMKAVDASIVKEFSNNRITGVNYSTVYLGGLQSVLQNATQFLLEKDRAGLAALQIKKQIAIAEAELALRTAESQSQIALQTSQRLNLEKDLELKAKELELRAEQILIAKEDLLIKKQELQIATKELELREKALLKAQSEIALLNEKVNTEKAQTSDVRVDGDAVVGVVGKQKELFDAQRVGFTNDHIQKMTKLQLDIYAVNKSAIPDIPQGMFIKPTAPYDDIWEITGGADVEPTSES